MGYRLFCIDSVVILQCGNSFKCARTMQVIGCSDFLRFFYILRSYDSFARVFAIWTGVYARVWCIFPPSPEERISRNFIHTFFACSEIEGLQMCAESLLSLFRSR